MSKPTPLSDTDFSVTATLKQHLITLKRIFLQQQEKEFKDQAEKREFLYLQIQSGKLKITNECVDKLGVLQQNSPIQYAAEIEALNLEIIQKILIEIQKQNPKKEALLWDTLMVGMRKILMNPPEGEIKQKAHALEKLLKSAGDLPKNFYQQKDIYGKTFEDYLAEHFKLKISNKNQDEIKEIMEAHRSILKKLKIGTDSQTYVDNIQFPQVKDQQSLKKAIEKIEEQNKKLQATLQAQQNCQKIQAPTLLKPSNRATYLTHALVFLNAEECKQLKTQFNDPHIHHQVPSLRAAIQSIITLKNLDQKIQNTQEQIKKNEEKITTIKAQITQKEAEQKTKIEKIDKIKTCFENGMLTDLIVSACIPKMSELKKAHPIEFYIDGLKVNMSYDNNTNDIILLFTDDQRFTVNLSTGKLINATQVFANGQKTSSEKKPTEESLSNDFDLLLDSLTDNFFTKLQERVQNQTQNFLAQLIVNMQDTEEDIKKLLEKLNKITEDNNKKALFYPSVIEDDPLYVALKSKKTKVFKELLTLRPKTDNNTLQRDKALLLKAAALNNLEAMQEIFKLEINPDILEKEKLLKWAVYHKNSEMLTYLFAQLTETDKTALLSPNKTTQEKNNTLFHHAVFNHAETMFLQLVESFHQENQVDIWQTLQHASENQASPLFLAFEDCEEIVGKYLDVVSTIRGPALIPHLNFLTSNETKQGISPLLLSFLGNNTGVQNRVWNFAIKFQQKELLAQKDDEGNTLLHYVIKSQNTLLLEKVLKEYKNSEALYNALITPNKNGIAPIEILTSKIEADHTSESHTKIFSDILEALGVEQVEKLLNDHVGPQLLKQASDNGHQNIASMLKNRMSANKKTSEAIDTENRKIKPSLYVQYKKQGQLPIEGLLEKLKINQQSLEAELEIFDEDLLKDTLTRLRETWNTTQEPQKAQYRNLLYITLLVSSKKIMKEKSLSVQQRAEKVKTFCEIVESQEEAGLKTGLLYEFKNFKDASGKNIAYYVAENLSLEKEYTAFFNKKSQALTKETLKQAFLAVRDLNEKLWIGAEVVSKYLNDTSMKIGAQQATQQQSALAAQNKEIETEIKILTKCKTLVNKTHQELTCTVNKINKPTSEQSAANKQNNKTNIEKSYKGLSAFLTTRQLENNALNVIISALENNNSVDTELLKNTWIKNKKWITEKVLEINRLGRENRTEEQKEVIESLKKKIAQRIQLNNAIIDKSNSIIEKINRDADMPLNILSGTLSKEQGRGLYSKNKEATDKFLTEAIKRKKTQNKQNKEKIKNLKLKHKSVQQRYAGFKKIFRIAAERYEGIMEKTEYEKLLDNMLDTQGDLKKQGKMKYRETKETKESKEAQESSMSLFLAKDLPMQEKEFKALKEQLEQEPDKTKKFESYKGYLEKQNAQATLKVYASFGGKRGETPLLAQGNFGDVKMALDMTTGMPAIIKKQVIGKINKQEWNANPANRDQFKALLPDEQSLVEFLMESITTKEAGIELGRMIRTGGTHLSQTAQQYINHYFLKTYSFQILLEGEELAVALRNRDQALTTKLQKLEVKETKETKEQILHTEIQERLKTATKYLQSLEVFHAKGLIHGDVKPRNMMADTLFDLGTARKMDATGKATDSINTGSAPHARNATPHFLAPELAEGNCNNGDRLVYPTKASDIYAAMAMITGITDEATFKKMQTERPDKNLANAHEQDKTINSERSSSSQQFVQLKDAGDEGAGLGLYHLIQELYQQDNNKYDSLWRQTKQVFFKGLSKDPKDRAEISEFIRNLNDLQSRLMGLTTARSSEKRQALLNKMGQLKGYSLYLALADFGKKNEEEIRVFSDLIQNLYDSDTRELKIILDKLGLVDKHDLIFPKDLADETPLFLALREGKTALFNILLEAGFHTSEEPSKIYEYNPHLKELIFYSAKMNNFDTLKSLLEKLPPEEQKKFILGEYKPESPLFVQTKYNLLEWAGYHRNSNMFLYLCEKITLDEILKDKKENHEQTEQKKIFEFLAYNKAQDQILVLKKTKSHDFWDKVIKQDPKGLVEALKNCEEVTEDFLKQSVESVEAFLYQEKKRLEDIFEQGNIHTIKSLIRWHAKHNNLEKLLEKEVLFKLIKTEKYEAIDFLIEKVREHRKKEALINSFVKSNSEGEVPLLNLFNKKAETVQCIFSKITHNLEEDLKTQLKQVLLEQKSWLESVINNNQTTLAVKAIQFINDFPGLIKLISEKTENGNTILDILQQKILNKEESAEKILEAIVQTSFSHPNLRDKIEKSQISQIIDPIEKLSRCIELLKAHGVQVGVPFGARYKIKDKPQAGSEIVLEQDKENEEDKENDKGKENAAKAFRTFGEDGHEISDSDLTRPLSETGNFPEPIAPYVGILKYLLNDKPFQGIILEALAKQTHLSDLHLEEYIGSLGVQFTENAQNQLLKKLIQQDLNLIFNALLQNSQTQKQLINLLKNNTNSLKDLNLEFLKPFFSEGELNISAFKNFSWVPPQQKNKGTLAITWPNQDQLEEKQESENNALKKSQENAIQVTLDFINDFKEAIITKLMEDCNNNTQTKFSVKQKKELKNLENIPNPSEEEKKTISAFYKTLATTKKQKEKIKALEDLNLLKKGISEKNSLRDLKKRNEAIVEIIEKIEPKQSRIRKLFRQLKAMIDKLVGRKSESEVEQSSSRSEMQKNLALKKRKKMIIEQTQNIKEAIRPEQNNQNKPLGKKAK